MRGQVQRFKFVVAVFFAPFFLGDSAVYAAEEALETVANRPGIAGPAKVTQPGVVGMDFGWERSFRSLDYKTSTAFSNIVRVGLPLGFEFHVAMDNYLSLLTAEHGRRSGVGDVAPGLKYRIFDEAQSVATFSVSYDVKIPVASRKKGLGTGRIDHLFGFLLGQEINDDWSWEASYYPSFEGKEGKKGFDDVHVLAASVSGPICGSLGFMGEFYGGPRSGRDVPAVARTDWALIWSPDRRKHSIWQLDAGIDIGLTAGAPDITFFAGFSVALDLFNRYPVKQATKTAPADSSC